MRGIALLLLAIAASAGEAAAGAGLPRAAQAALDALGAEQAKADAALADAEAEHRTAMRKARERALAALRRSLQRGMGPAEQAAILREILRIDRTDADAVAFFSAVGSLDAVLAELGPAPPGDDLLGDGPATSGGMRAAADTKLVLWNQHNGNANDRGTLRVTVTYALGGREVGRLTDQAVPWKAGVDSKIELAVPTRFDRIRIEILAVQAQGGGLAEVVLATSAGANALTAWKISASGSYSPSFAPEKLVDGITTSANFGVGYWLLPNRAPTGWVEFTAQ